MRKVDQKGIKFGSRHAERSIRLPAPGAVWLTQTRSEMSRPGSGKHIDSLDGLRGLAILLVLAFRDGASDS